MEFAPARIDVEIRLQTFGLPSSGYVERSPAVFDTFPGFDVEALMKPLVREVDAKEILLPKLSNAPSAEEIQAFKEAAETQVRELFRVAVQDTGPAVGERWDLLSEPLFTGSQKPRWVPGLDAIAFELGTEPIDMQFKVVGGPRAHRQVWKDDHVFAKTWICFRLVR